MSRPLRKVVIVDDHEIFRAGLKAGLDRTIQVVGEAGSVETAVPLVQELEPDVVLLDVHLPDGGGETVVGAVHTERPAVRFLALSVSDAAEDVVRVIRAGARGYVTKSISPEDLIDAIHRTADGDAVFSPWLAGFVLDAFTGDGWGRGRGAHGALGHRRRRDRPAQPARAGGPAADRTRLHLQGDRRPPAPLGEDDRDPRLQRPAQAPALEPQRAHPLGGEEANDLRKAKR